MLFATNSKNMEGNKFTRVDASPPTLNPTCEEQSWLRGLVWTPQGLSLYLGLCLEEGKRAMVLGMEEVWGIQRKTPYLLICSLLRALPPSSLARQALWEAEQTPKNLDRDFLGGPVVKNLPSNTGDTGSIPWSGNQDPICFRAAKPERHYHFHHTLSPLPLPSSQCNERSCMPQLGPNTAKNKEINIFKKGDSVVAN